MRRPLLLSTGFLGLDQLTKIAAAAAFADAPWTIGAGWGLTYVVNPGVYVWPEIPGAALAALHAVALASWLAGVLALRWYRRWYRSSVLVDLAFACLTVATLGNLMDRLIVGGARDWAVTPIATGNLADVSGWLIAVLVLGELAAYAPARRLLSVNPRRWRPRAQDQRAAGARPTGMTPIDPGAQTHDCDR